MRKINYQKWATKVINFIEYIFEEEEEDVEANVQVESQEPEWQEPQTTYETSDSNSSGWNLLLFLDLVQCILLVLAIAVSFI